MNTRRQLDDFGPESSHALLDLSLQHERSEARRDSVPSPPSVSSNGSFRDPTLPTELSEVPFPAYPEKAPIVAPFTKRLGRHLLLCNIGAIALLLGSISVLSFLWFGNDSNIHWTTVMIDGWVGQAVTISTLAVRLAVATQASTAVAMLAAIQLEAKSSGGVLLADAPAISVARHGNTGPLTSILSFRNDASWKKCRIILPLMAVLALCTLISQFTSTLLLWDVRTGVVHGPPQTTLGAVGMGMEGYVSNSARPMTGGYDYWTSSPQSFPTFAEYNAKPQVQSTSIADTGPTIRALLPISSQLDRPMVSTFEGTAAVFDARVFCVRPVITDWNITLNHSEVIGENIYFQGHAKPSELTEELEKILRFNQSEHGLFFECVLGGSSVDPTFKICSFHQPLGGIINSLDPLFNASLDSTFDDELKANIAHQNNQKWPIELGHTFLIISSKFGSTLDNGLLQLSEFNFSYFSLHSRGVWVDVTSPLHQDHTLQDHISAEFSVTICYDTWYDAVRYDALGYKSYRIKHLQEISIFASRPGNSSEPSLRWDPERRSYDTAAIRSQLAARADSHIDRVILELDIRKLKQSQQIWSGSWAPSRQLIFPDGTDEVLWFPNITSDLGFEDGPIVSNDTLMQLINHTDETYDFIHMMMWEPFYAPGSRQFDISAPCGNCSGLTLQDSHVTYKTLNPILSAIFRDTLIETDNPALAWQALTTTVARMAYYDWLPTFDSYAPITTTWMVPCQVPKHHTGFTIVTVNLVVHLGLFIVITIWFYKATKTSLLNNAWQAVAQLNSSETEELFHRATTATDAEVKKWIKEGQEPRRRFRIVNDGRSDRAHLS